MFLAQATTTCVRSSNMPSAGVHSRKPRLRPRAVDDIEIAAADHRGVSSNFGAVDPSTGGRVEYHECGPVEAHQLAADEGEPWVVRRQRGDPDVLSGVEGQAGHGVQGLIPVRRSGIGDAFLRWE